MQKFLHAEVTSVDLNHPLTPLPSPLNDQSLTVAQLNDEHIETGRKSHGWGPTPNHPMAHPLVASKVTGGELLDALDALGLSSWAQSWISQMH